jgi:hypothetical protein
MPKNKGKKMNLVYSWKKREGGREREREREREDNSFFVGKDKKEKSLRCLGTIYLS